MCEEIFINLKILLSMQKSQGSLLGSKFRAESSNSDLMPHALNSRLGNWDNDFWFQNLSMLSLGDNIFWMSTIKIANYDLIESAK